MFYFDLSQVNLPMTNAEIVMEIATNGEMLNTILENDDKMLIYNVLYILADIIYICNEVMFSGLNLFISQ